MQNENGANPFANFTLSDDAAKLANAIYNTYVLNDDPELYISVDRLCGVFGRKRDAEGIAYVGQLFTEINEPIAVSDFEYHGTIFGWKILEFCSFLKPWHAEDEHIELEINEIYLEAMSRFMETPFLTMLRKEEK